MKRLFNKHILITGASRGLGRQLLLDLDLLSAFLPAEIISSAYHEAIRMGFLWHEFGDLNLIV
jgi:S-adenosylmethionine:tRNA ribosyltransferase-isomerase